MHRGISLLIVSLFLVASTAGASVEAPAKVLRVHGPGGPHNVLVACANLFEEKYGIEVVVRKALPHELDLKLPQQGKHQIFPLLRYG